MVKFVVSSPYVFNIVSRIPVVRNIFVVNIGNLNSFFQVLKNPNSIFQYILTQNKTSKQTAYKRFENLDTVSLKYISDGALIHDIAVSSGITSVELFDLLSGNRKNIKYHVSDKFSEYYVTQGWLSRIFDKSGELIGFYLFGIYATDHLPNKYPISRLLFRIINHYEPKDRLHQPSPNAEHAVLLCNELRNRIKDGVISHLEYDVFSSSLTNEFNFVRCMNLLNISYFTEDKLICAVKNIFRSLREGGIFQVGRTHSDNTHHVSFFIKENNKMRLLEEINSGSEIKHLIN